MCDEQGKLRAATVVDHIQAHKGDPVLTWARWNLRGLCKQCHDRKTARTDNNKAFGRWKRIPEFVKRPPFPVTVVCGAPASGKRTYTQAQSASDAIVIDPEQIAATLSGQPMHTADMTNWLAPTMLERNQQLAKLYTSRASEAWLLVRSSRLKDRRAWARILGAKVVVMETAEDTCIDRIRHSQRIDKPADKVAVSKWWHDYVSDMSDTVIRHA
ncbi:HNH endonuclease [uncultured Paraglaciecola sp.]|uniref:HNH endonuclease n=1 Tax=uncultured Paraglaciecola sp. TaxID=1765024 RepID=UPI002628680F|nr:HNH endonuclease [uncultured Paraglaciecola sp.]